MSDDRPRSPDDLARALRETANRLMSPWTAAGPVRSTAPPGLPAPPVTAWARQVQAVLDDLAARRAQVQALRSQLEVFDEQLGSLEAGLRPLLEWTRPWVELERAMAEFWSPPRHDKSEKGEGGASG